MTQHTHDQIQCALNQQQQARIGEVEAERAATPQQVNSQVQGALSKHQYQQPTQIAQLVQEQMQLHTEQRQTEAVEWERELQKLQKQLDRYQSKTNKQLGSVSLEYAFFGANGGGRGQFEKI